MEGDRALNRRTFLSAGLSSSLIGLTAKSERPVAGGFVNESFALGHRLRDRIPFAAPKQTVRVPVVIVGGGIAGLSAAWRLQKRGFRDFLLLEMEPEPGGNSRSGENDVSRFPWAAHYVPVPGRGAALVRELFEDLGVLQAGKWDERYLCFAPQERLFLHGRWQEGLEPEIAATPRDREQYRRFASRMQAMRATGEFTVPIDRGARPSALDTISFAQWLRENQFDSPYLLWYANYACRDDYGAALETTSAWAGIHYFASREPEEKGPITAAEGNGWIVRRLTHKLARYIHTGSAVYRIIPERTGARILTEAVEYRADAVVFAAPSFLASYLIQGAPPAEGFVYSPWVTANVTLDRLPVQKGSEPAWDNVLFQSASLGYVDATHMTLRTFRDRSVWTWYRALHDFHPVQGRRWLLQQNWGYWKDAILDDLSRAHPDIRQCVSRIDVMRIGHAMIRPRPGFQFSESRRRWIRPLGRIHFAHSDLSGVSIFEEAQYRGVTAADRVLRAI